MIARYTRPAMGAIWSPEQRVRSMQIVEAAVAKAQANLGLIPQAAATAIGQKPTLSLNRIEALEQKTRHDVGAMLKLWSSKLPKSARPWLHYGLTSSDVLDTALSLQIQEGGTQIQAQLTQLRHTLKHTALEHKDTLCVGRTHGMHAALTSFGLKLIGFWAELGRCQKRLAAALQGACMCKLSGAVGNYMLTKGILLEQKVALSLKLKPELAATQIVPRDRHADVLFALTQIGAAIERVGLELRHLQRTEVGEVQEGTQKGQMGSSAMPHKKNPIASENISGLARLLRSYLVAGQQNIALWHERDISHSSVERVILPDAFIVCDYMLWRGIQVLQDLQIFKTRMLQNVFISQGTILSAQLLLMLVQKGMERDKAYAYLQAIAYSLKKGECFLQKTKQHKELKKFLPRALEPEFFFKKTKTQSRAQIKRVLRHYK